MAKNYHVFPSDANPLLVIKRGVQSQRHSSVAAADGPSLTSPPPPLKSSSGFPRQLCEDHIMT